MMLTLKELKSMTKEDDYRRNDMPSIRQVEESGSRIVVREMVCDIQITVYEDGYVTCRREHDWTVFRLHDCGAYRYGAAVEADVKNFAADFFEEEPWYIRIFIEAEDRLEANQERKHRMHQISLDAIAHDYCPEFADATWEGLACLIAREDREEFLRFLRMMTRKQQRVILLYFAEREAMEDIARKLGVTYQAVSDMKRRAIARVRRKENIPAAGIPRDVYNHKRKAADTDE